MARQLQSDKILFGAVVGLVLFGALMVFSASAVMAADRYNNAELLPAPATGLGGERA